MSEFSIFDRLPYRLGFGNDLDMSGKYRLFCNQHFRKLISLGLVFVLLAGVTNASEDTIPCFFGDIALIRPSNAKLLQFLRSNEGQKVYLNILIETSIWGSLSLSNIKLCNSFLNDYKNWLNSLESMRIRFPIIGNKCSKDSMVFESVTDTVETDKNYEERLHRINANFMVTSNESNGETTFILNEVLKRSTPLLPADRFSRMNKEKSFEGKCHAK